jgi:hypothetical protein
MKRRRSSWATLGIVILGLILPLDAARAATIIKAKKGNGTIATALLIDLVPELILKQKTPNNTLATAQPVSPTYMARDVLGSLSTGQPQAFFAFPVTDGATISVAVSAKDPTTEFTELLLYDANENLVAIANGNAADGSNSFIDFSVFLGGGGTWTAEVTGSPSHPDPKASLFKYDLRISSPITYAIDVLGKFGKNNAPGFYQVATNDGDQLHFNVSPLKPPTGLPELQLYDANGNLVAIANGNGSDGVSSFIDFTVPGGGGGNWTAEVTGSPSAPDPATNLFTYALTMVGATGTGPVTPK